MAKIIGVHGAFHQLWGPHEVAGRWRPAVRDGLWHAGVEIADNDFSVAFYGDLFRWDPAEGRATDEELRRVAREAGMLETLEQIGGPGGLSALAELVGKETLRQLVNQLGRYFADDALRHEVQQRLGDAIDGETSVIIAHSMGTVVAYEALAANPQWPVRSLVTIGSPLGTDFVLPHLRPEAQDGRGQWPGAVARWTNVAAVGDPAAGEPHLANVFGDRVNDLAVDNGHRAHDPEPYLNAAATGRAVASMLELD